MIACFLSNISAKCYKNPSMLSRVIAKNVGDVFLRLSVVDCADDELFNNIISNPYHSTLPKETVSSYGLMSNSDKRELLNKSSRLVESCFIVRMLYEDTLSIYLLLHCWLCVLSESSDNASLSY